MVAINKSQANQIAGQTIGKAFVAEAKQSPVGEIKSEYQAFLGTLNGDAQKAFDSFINENAPVIANFLGVNDKLDGQAFKAKSDAIFEKFGARAQDKAKLFHDVLGSEVMVGREEHQMNFSLSEGPNGNVVAKMSVWKPKPNDSMFEVLITETLASAKLTFADDGSYTVDSKSIAGNAVDSNPVDSNPARRRFRNVMDAVSNPVDSNPVDSNPASGRFRNVMDAVAPVSGTAGDVKAAKAALDTALKSDPFAQENKVLGAEISGLGELILPSMVMWHTSDRLEAHIKAVAKNLPELAGVSIILSSQNFLE